MSLSQDMKSLTQNIVGSYETRVAGIASIHQQSKGLREDTRVELQGLDRAHQAMARELRHDLAEGHATLATVVESQREAARSHMAELGRAHQAMAGELTQDLVQGRAGLAQARARQKAGIAAVIIAITNAHAEASREWKGMVSQLLSKRSAGAAPIAPASPLEEASPKKMPSQKKKRSAR